MANETNEKYCKHSKFKNKLCGRVNEVVYSIHGYGSQCSTCWEVCAIPSQQVEVIEKDLMDRTIDGVLNISDDQSYYCQRGTLRKLLKVYGEAIESEKKPCSKCLGYKEFDQYDYCADCGRKLR